MPPLAVRHSPSRRPPTGKHAAEKASPSELRQIRERNRLMKLVLEEARRQPSGSDYVWGGKISLQRLDEEYVPALKFPLRIDLYDKMDNDAKIAAQRRLTTMPLISAVRWSAKGGTQEQRDLLSANILREGDPALWCETSWLQRLNEMFRSLKYGFSLFGKTWETVGTYRIIRRLTYLHPKSLGGPLGPWEWNKQGTRLVAIHRHYRLPDGEMVTDERIPIGDIFAVIWDLTGENWEGVSMLRAMYRAWTEKDILSRIGMIDAQNRGVGMPDAELGPNDGKADRDALVEIVKSMRGGNPERRFSVRSNGQKLQFLTSQGTVVDTGAMIAARNNEIASSATTDFAQSGQTASGSRATSSVLMVSYMQDLDATRAFFQEIINHGSGYLKGYAEEIQDQNFTKLKSYAYIEGTKVSPTDQLDNVPNILDAVQKGSLVHDLHVENHVRRALGVKELTQREFEELKKRAEPPDLGGRPPEVGDFDREEPRDDKDGRRFGLQEKKTLGGANQPRRSPESWPWLRSTAACAP